MEDKLLDSTLIGVIIGSFLSFIGNVITQHYSIKKEERQWERQRISSREEREEKDRSIEIENIRELYHKCVLSLSVYITSIQNNDKDENERFQLDEIKGIHHWLSLLLLRHPNKQLTQLIDSFITTPDEYDAERLRKYVLELIQYEELLDYPDLTREFSQKNKEKERTITFRINDDYRRCQMVSGIELPQSYSYRCEIKDLSSDHRDRLLKIYFTSIKTIPDSVQLYLPVCTPGAKKIVYQSKSWEAKLNPANFNLSEVMDQWVEEFDKNLEEAEQVLQQSA